MEVEIDTLREQERFGSKWKSLQLQCKDLEHNLLQIQRVTNGLSEEVLLAKAELEKRKGVLKKETVVL